MKIKLIILLLIISTSVLMSCGRKGPLYLVDEQNENQTEEGSQNDDNKKKN